MFELKGKVALVTGAASGIGFAYTKELLRNKFKGVALVDVDNIKGENALKEITKEFGISSAIFVKADVSDNTQIEKAFEKTVQTYKQLDMVINNAGIVQELQWEKCVAANLVGVISGSMFAMDKFLPKYKSGPEGIIINTASAAGLFPLQEGPVYSATKSGVINFTRAMGGNIRYTASKVKILAVCPEFIDTNLVNITKEQIEEPYLSNLLKIIAQQPCQTPEALVKNVMKIINDAPSGSIWVTRDDCLTQVKFPNIIHNQV